MVSFHRQLDVLLANESMQSVVSAKNSTNILGIDKSKYLHTIIQWIMKWNGRNVEPKLSKQRFYDSYGIILFSVLFQQYPIWFTICLVLDFRISHHLWQKWPTGWQKMFLYADRYFFLPGNLLIFVPGQAWSRLMELKTK